jgi:hypothetical protein
VSDPRRADVLLVLGPPEPWRIRWAEELVDRGVAGALLISVPDPHRVAACREAGVTCFVPDPFTTRGEARFLRAAMTEHGWRTADVITATPHGERARFSLGRCVARGAQVVGRAPGTSVPWWAFQYLYQMVGWVRAVTQSGC